RGSVPSGRGAGTTETSSQPSWPQLSRICLVACESSATVWYSHLVIRLPHQFSGRPLRTASRRRSPYFPDTGRVPLHRPPRPAPAAPNRLRGVSEREYRSPGLWDTCAGARLHIVTGKGGTGKTTAATALATALASGGGRVLLVEVEGRQGVASLLERSPLPYEERPMLSATGGGTVSVLAADPEAALKEYLELFYGMRRA